MKCNGCGGALERRRGTVIFESKVIGNTRVDDIDMYACDSCGTQLLLPGESDRVTNRVLSLEMERVGEEAIELFIGEKEAARILGQSKQAFNKSKKVRAGFVLFTEMDGRRWYLTDSVQQFKATGDGRAYLGPPSSTLGLVGPAMQAGQEVFLFNSISIFPELVDFISTEAIHANT